MPGAYAVSGRVPVAEMRMASLGAAARHQSGCLHHNKLVEPLANWSSLANCTAGQPSLHLDNERVNVLRR
jgi:hypothetical protein